MDIRKDGASMIHKLQPLLDAAAKALPCPFCGEDGEVDADENASCSNRACAACLFAVPVAEWNRRAPSSLELRLREYVGELEADCADKGIAQPIAAAIRREIADRLKSLMEGKP